MNARDIILKPVITEDSMNLLEDGKYTFDVHTDADKTQVKNAVQEIFDVKVKSVNIMNVRGKKKRVGQHVGLTRRRRKAIVTLTSDSKQIKIFED